MNGQVHNSGDRPAMQSSRETNSPATKPKLSEATKYKQSHHETTEHNSSRPERFTSGGAQKDDRREARRSTMERGNNKHYSEDRSNSQQTSEYRGVSSGSQGAGGQVKREAPRGESHHTSDRPPAEYDQRSRGDRHVAGSYGHMQVSQARL